MRRRRRTRRIVFLGDAAGSSLRVVVEKRDAHGSGLLRIRDEFASFAVDRDDTSRPLRQNSQSAICADSTIRSISSTYSRRCAVHSIGRSECVGCRPASGLISMSCGLPCCVAAQVEAAAVAAADRPPGRQRDSLRLGHLLDRRLAARGDNSPALRTALCCVRIHVGSAVGRSMISSVPSTSASSPVPRMPTVNSRPGKNCSTSTGCS